MNLAPGIPYMCTVTQNKHNLVAGSKENIISPISHFAPSVTYKRQGSDHFIPGTKTTSGQIYTPQ